MTAYNRRLQENNASMTAEYNANDSAFIIQIQVDDVEFWFQYTFENVMNSVAARRTWRFITSEHINFQIVIEADSWQSSCRMITPTDEKEFSIVQPSTDELSRRLTNLTNRVVQEEATTASNTIAIQQNKQKYLALQQRITQQATIVQLQQIQLRQQPINNRLQQECATLKQQLASQQTVINDLSSQLKALKAKPIKLPPKLGPTQVFCAAGYNASGSTSLTTQLNQYISIVQNPTYKIIFDNVKTKVRGDDTAYYTVINGQLHYAKYINANDVPKQKRIAVSITGYNSGGSNSYANGLATYKQIVTNKNYKIIKNNVRMRTCGASTAYYTSINGIVVYEK